MGSVLFTGFPGFLGVELLPRIMMRAADDTAVCVVQAKFADLAIRRVAQIEAAHPELTGRIRLVEGDITRSGLGLDGRGGSGVRVEDVVEIWHLAAAYDLEVPRPVGMAVNVEGTRNVLGLARRANSLRRLHYVSTCYVSGRYAGPFGEDDLEVGQKFNNYYEETKFLAELLVQTEMADGLPATIYRPAIVVGDHRTGATQKYDGPYFVIRWLLAQPRIAVMPVIGEPSSFRLNMVPRDFVMDAVITLSGSASSEGRVYQLADPAALTVDVLLKEMARATDRRVIRVPVPRNLAKAAIRHIPGVYGLMRIPAATVDYMSHPTHYLTSNTQADLAGSGIVCPDVRSYLPALVEFMKANPDVSSAAMV